MGNSKLKLKKSKKFSFNKVLDALKNKNNKKILGTVISLSSILMIIAFISYLLEWKADDSIVSEDGYTIFNNETKNQIGGLGAQVSNRFIKLWFGVSAIFIPFTTLIIGLRILGLKKIKLGKIIFNSLLALILLPICIHHFFGGMITAGGLGIFVNELLRLSIDL